ncbi:diguanylate cyclase [Acuticoccus sp. M5D2P5]|uniref:GGDEF domain-containing protein n=1 Tax=Acuticoccus kalidii TaxID=2910977 RepID=UPI001F456544|nr:diguanylate cyclase [Acuticoccus kalidii]MCF3936185.1 diguanylate cyclase [Acuticoccus kalidii]
MTDIFLHLAQSAGILMLGAVVLGVVFDHTTSARRDLCVGIACGLLACGLMAMSMRASGFVIDGRGAVLAAAGLFGGPIGAVAALPLPLFLRNEIGGPAVVTGVVSMVAQAMLGVAVQHLRKRGGGAFERRSVLWLAAASPLVILALYIPGLAPASTAGLRAEIAVALLLWLPFSTLVFGLSTMNELSRANRLRAKRFTGQFERATGLIDGTLFDAQLMQHWRLHERYGSGYVYMLVSIDDVAALRRTYRGADWERLVVDIARALRGAIRHCDLCTRTDIDRFAVLLPHTTLPLARPVAERIASRVARTVTRPNMPNGRITVSIGIADVDGTQLPLDVLGIAEGELFLANGRMANGAIGPVEPVRKIVRSFPGAVIEMGSAPSEAVPPIGNDRHASRERAA